MPIISIIEQPGTNALKAAYRPIVFVVRASRTDGNAKPPIVFCDIYVDGVFYKTQERTIYKTLNSSDSDWKFDIMDACQEVLVATVQANGGSAIVKDSLAMRAVYCKFRSSGYDTNSFITAEGTAPVQGTGTMAPVAGTGTQSTTFYVAISTLQHEQNQDLSAHLNFYKNGTWNANVYPLSHRKNGYKVCKGDSDYFPIVNLSNNDLKCMVLHYKMKGSNSFSSETYCPGAPCTPVSIPSFSFPRATKDVAYSYSITMSGTGPLNLTSFATSATWMGRSISGNVLTFSGTPAESDVGTGIEVSFTIENACGSVSLNKTIDVVETTCIPVGIVGTPVLPDAQVGVLYDFTISYSGDGPFTVQFSGPVWMSAYPGSDNKSTRLVGTPTQAATGLAVSLHVTNCSSSNSVDFADTIDVLVGERHLDIANYDSISGAVTDVCTVQMTFTRTNGAMQDAQASNQTVQATYTIRFDSGYVHDYNVVFNPTDTQVVMSVDGTGGSSGLYCAGVETSTVKSVTVVP